MESIIEKGGVPQDSNANLRDLADRALSLSLLLHLKAYLRKLYNISATRVADFMKNGPKGRGGDLKRSDDIPALDLAPLMSSLNTDDWPYFQAQFRTFEDLMQSDDSDLPPEDLMAAGTGTGTGNDQLDPNGTPRMKPKRKRTTSTPASGKKKKKRRKDANDSGDSDEDYVE
eukprot:TRINITY_DN13073_c0_g1::TRINITY_DN13073_c0_g1_i1::g.10602::m.10602 TRINITY_DN13073_c0_g1::TRINITY_DN13073_c0_g1_i1::g.10602  ORF type:complete len:186 (+),score=35.58,Fiji_64_capsid/PF05880.6/0.11 TRINITY_DN13073_c0_g1_i1:44-559(+)